MARGTEFLFEIHGDQGDLTLTATTRASMQRQELTVEAHKARQELVETRGAAKYRWVPDGLPGDSAKRRAAYARLAESIRGGKPASQVSPAAVTRHRLLTRICKPRKPAETGALAREKAMERRYLRPNCASRATLEIVDRPRRRYRSTPSTPTNSMPPLVLEGAMTIRRGQPTHLQPRRYLHDGSGLPPQRRSGPEAARYLAGRHSPAQSPSAEISDHLSIRHPRV